MAVVLARAALDRGGFARRARDHGPSRRSVRCGPSRRRDHRDRRGSGRRALARALGRLFLGRPGPDRNAPGLRDCRRRCGRPGRASRRRRLAAGAEPGARPVEVAGAGVPDGRHRDHPGRRARRRRRTDASRRRDPRRPKAAVAVGAAGLAAAAVVAAAGAQPPPSPRPPPPGPRSRPWRSWRSAPSCPMPAPAASAETPPSKDRIIAVVIRRFIAFQVLQGALYRSRRSSLVCSVVPAP